jgi:hypothetical protein
MPDIISRTLQNAPLLLQWYQWGVIVGFFGALAVTAWIFVDAQRSGQEATLWKSLAAVASVVGIPALLARAHGGFAFEMRDSLSLVAMFSIAGAVLAVVAVLGYLVLRGRAVDVCDVCGQPQLAGWAQCPYHPAPQPFTPVPITDSVAPPAPAPKETRIGDLSPLAAGSGRPAPHRGTVILTREEEPRPLALLIINSGPYANTTLPLKAGVTTLGRDGQVNDHPIDDPAVSERHLSIRYLDGQFWATDLDSSNGTFVNDQKIGRHVLQPNDVIRLGKTSLVFVQVSTIGEPGAAQRNGSEQIERVG